MDQICFSKQLVQLHIKTAVYPLYITYMIPNMHEQMFFPDFSC